jgi:hypothetical protein
MPFFIVATYSFTDYFRGFENANAVRQLFDERTKQVLRNLRVESTVIDGYMWVNDVDGHLVVSSCHFSGGDGVDVDLDVIHELVHVNSSLKEKSSSMHTMATSTDTRKSGLTITLLKRQDEWA